MAERWRFCAFEGAIAKTKKFLRLSRRSNDYLDEDNEVFVTQEKSL